MTEVRRGTKTASILVIEDHAATARGLCALLRTRGHRVDSATDADSGVARVQKKRYDLVLTDLDLGDEHEPTVLARMRITRPGLAVLVVSARDRASVLRSIEDPSGVDYLEKPVDPERLLAAVEALLPPRLVRRAPTHSS
jgi:DNA-binding response OmpR family regulator